MNLFVTTVGTGRNREDIAKAIAFSIQTMNPDRILLFTSNKTQEETYPLVLEQLNKEMQSRCCPQEFPNEDDVQFLFTAYVERIRQELHDHTNDTEKPTLWVDFTSGTKAMTAAVFAAGIALEAKEVCYVVGERDATGRVMQSENVKRIEPQLVSAERDIAEARELFNQQDYAAAAKSVERVKKLFDKGTHLGNLGNIIFALGQAYAAWNRFEWKQAAKLLRENKKVFQRNEPNFVDAKLLERQAEFCERLEHGDYDVARLVDLYANALRCHKEECFDDAMARLYRAFEYSIQIRLHSKFKLNTSNLHWDKIESQLCDETIQKLKKMPKPIKIGLREGIELLAELQDPLGKELVADYWIEWTPGMEYKDRNAGPLQTYLKSRNDSFLAHGTKPIARTIVKNLLDKFEQYLHNLLGDEFDDLITLATFLRI